MVDISNDFNRWKLLIDLILIDLLKIYNNIKALIGSK